jgi:trehalose 6-phosphate phosphatase
MDPAFPLAPLAAEPRSTALILDVDGTLAPIVDRPELARVPNETRAELHRLVARYLLVACLSGRPRAQAAELVGVAGIRYVGNHGLELDPRAEELEREVAAFRDEIGGEWPVEDKGLSLSLHYREASDEPGAVAILSRIAGRAHAHGLDTRWGRKVLEIRPHADTDKGAAVRALLAETGAELAMCAGDDTTDLDAFRGLREAGLRHAVCVAVTSPEAPAALLAGADLVVDGPDGLLLLLRAL